MGMWCEGENPLFRDRLATSEQPKPGPPLQDNEPGQKGIPDSVDLPDCAVDKEKQASCDSESPGQGSAPKRPRLSTEGGAPALTKAETTTTDFPLSAQSSAVDLPACGNEPNGETKPGQDTCVIAGASSALTEVKEASSNGETGASQAELKEDTRRLVQKGFEPERWKPDPLCESCRLKYIDPKPCDLLLYLHAFKYKVGWSGKIGEVEGGDTCGGTRLDEVGSPVLGSQKQVSRSLLPIHFLFCFPAVCSLLVSQP